MITRRIAIAALPLILAACATHPTAPTIASKTQLVADAVNALAAQVALLGVTIPDKIVASVNAIAADVQSHATAIAAALDPAPIIQAIYSDVILVGDLLAPFFPKAPKIAAAVASATKLIADLMSELGVQPK